MRMIGAKISITLAIGLLVVASLPFIGLTVKETDSTEGVVIDFGYWEVVWTPMGLDEGTDGNGALEKACEANGFPLVYADEAKSKVWSVNDQFSLHGMEWGMYVLSSGSWVGVDDPREVDVGGHRLVCWARASGADGVIPGTDSTGFTYYGYSRDGLSPTTGERLRVVTLAPSVTEILCSVGGLDMIVGTDHYSDYPREIAEGKESGRIKVVGGYTDPNYEWIIKLGPDLVFCDGGAGEHVNMANKLRKSGVDCVVLYNATNVERLYDNMWIAAAAIGMEEKANAAIAAARSTVNAVTGVIGAQACKRVFVSLSADPSPWTAGSGTFVSDLISKVTGANVFDGQASSWFMVSKEQIHAKQPQYIVIIMEGGEMGSREAYEALLEGLDPVWKETPAFRNGDVYVFSGGSADVLSRPGPRLTEACELLGKILHPEPFLERDPMDLMPKYLGDDYRHYLRYQRVAA